MKLRILTPIVLGIFFICEGFFAGMVFTDTCQIPYNAIATQNIQSVTQSIYFNHILQAIRKSIPVTSPLASVLRTEEQHTPLDNVVRGFIVDGYTHTNLQNPSEKISILDNPVFLSLACPDDFRSKDSSNNSNLLIGKQVKDPLFWNHVNGRCEVISSPKLTADNRLKATPTKKQYNRTRLIQEKASQYRQAVSIWSRRFHLKPDLVYAIMYTESSFNPNLISSRFAHGLMQVVPNTAGEEVKRWLGEDKIPTPSELLDPYTNIKYGVGYFRLLLQRHFGLIRDSLSREYCAIAAYNSGSTPVLKLFGNTRGAAITAINSLDADDVLSILIDRIPMDETRRYIRKVLDARQYFIAFNTISNDYKTASRAVLKN